MKSILNIAVCLAIVLAAVGGMPVSAQVPSDQPIVAYNPYSPQELDQLLGPIALYPDPLIAEILPASTFAAQIVLADRYLNTGGDPGLIEQQPWDASVQAVAHYPQVLKWLDNNLAWTTALGQAFTYQQQDVMDAIQRLRAQAQRMGNLRSTPQQEVVIDNGQIEILPANPQVIYVPQYSPDVVYYETAYGVPFITFSVGFPIGMWLNCDFDWHEHHLILWNHQHPRPPNWWHLPPAQRRSGMEHHTTVWHPANHNGHGSANYGDRGWPAQDHSATRPQEHHAEPGHGPSVATPARPPVTTAPHDNHPRENRAPSLIQVPNSASSAFIGIQNANAARAFSVRGQQSRGFAPPRSSPPPQHAAPPPQHSSPPPQPSSHSGGDQDRGHGRH